MKICIIDIGSNSVRLALLADGKTLYKRLATTRLGEGLSFTGVISPEALGRTVRAVAELKAQAVAEGAEEIYAFATAAVRSAANGAEFVSRVKAFCGLDIDVIDGEQEAAIGMLGALKGEDGGLIDVGGASTEVTVQKNKKAIYSKSVDVGAVRLFDLAGRNRDKLELVIAEKIAQYGNITSSFSVMAAIGGTATTVASVKHGLKVYDSAVVDGTRVSVGEIGAMADRLLSLSVEEVRSLDGMDPRRADVIGGGCLLLYRILQKLKVAEIVVSESDNIEGYYMLKKGNA